MTKNSGVQDPICRVFQAGMATVNFHNSYHIDPKDKHQITHCSFSPPSKWIEPKNNGIRKCAFGLGSVVVDLSDHAQRISFLPKTVKHCTSEPWNVPSVPSFLFGDTCSKTVMKHTKEVYACLEDSMLAWGNWSWWHANAHRNNEWLSVIDNCSTRAEQIAARRALIRRWEEMYGFTHESEQQRIARAYCQGKRKRKHSLNRAAKRPKKQYKIKSFKNIIIRRYYNYITFNVSNIMSYNSCVVYLFFVSIQCYCMHC